MRQGLWKEPHTTNELLLHNQPCSVFLQEFCKGLTLRNENVILLCFFNPNGLPQKNTTANVLVEIQAGPIPRDPDFFPQRSACSW